MAYLNRIRLPFQLHSPQFPEERSVFRKSNGETKTLSVIVSKTYEIETDYFPERWHQRFKIALAHDNVFVEGEKYLGGISQDGDYNIEWIDNPLRYPTAKASTKVQVTPFDATNANCQTCDSLSQLSLTNDLAQGLYGGFLVEDTDYSVDTAANDSICCYPAVFSLTSFNTDYLTSASIDPATGEMSFHTGTGLVSGGNINIATYRVTCPNGDYDEADVFADIDGSIDGCLAPTDITVTAITDDTAQANWHESTPGSDYYWELYEGDGPIGSSVQTGPATGTSVVLSGLDELTDYYFQIKTICYGSESGFSSTSFSTTGTEASCGNYGLTYTAPPGSPSFFFNGYTDCAGVNQVVAIPRGTTRYICALENSPGDPFNIQGDPQVLISYIGIC